MSHQISQQSFDGKSKYQVLLCFAKTKQLQRHSVTTIKRMKRLHQIFNHFLVFSFCAAFVFGAAPDQHENCKFWAESGECDRNPGYMMDQCATSCEQVAAQALKDSKELEGINSFFDLGANDINGNRIEFSKFRGQVTIVINVASYCGHTDSHYRGLVKLWRQVKSLETINLLAFPCNQFGSQEPGSNEEIEEFAHGYGVEFTMMDKIDVNGPNSNIVYKYLKSKAEIGSISWNFASK